MVHFIFEEKSFWETHKISCNLALKFYLLRGVEIKNEEGK